MKRIWVYVNILTLSFFTASGAIASPALFDWAFNVDGILYENYMGDTVPDYFDDNLFDWDTGLGTLTVNFNPGSTGDYFFIAFFDHEFVDDTTSYFDEYGATGGASPASGQSWEIDEPGYVFGDIYAHLKTGMLDNTNGVPVDYEDDVSMAMGWDFALGDNEMATMDLIVSAELPTAFFLSQYDPLLQETIYFSSSIDIYAAPAAVPEPGALILFGTGLLLVWGTLKKRTCN